MSEINGKIGGVWKDREKGGKAKNSRRTGWAGPNGVKISEMQSPDGVRRGFEVCRGSREQRQSLGERKLGIGRFLSVRTIEPAEKSGLRERVDAWKP